MNTFDATSAPRTRKPAATPVTSEKEGAASQALGGLQAAINRSPRVFAQSRSMGATFGDAVQRQGESLRSLFGPAAGPPLQRRLTYGAQPVADVSQLGGVKIGEGQPASKKEFFNVSAKQWKEKLGQSKWRKQEARDAFMQELFDALIELIKDTGYEESVTAPDALKLAVYNYRDFRSKSQMALETAKQSLALGPMPDPRDGEEMGVSELALPLYRAIERTGRAFPQEQLLNVARKAKAEEPGFVYELELALDALRQMPTARVQFGALSLEAIKVYLPGELHEYTQPQKGMVGGDVTVWIPGRDPMFELPPPSLEGVKAQFGADFVQAKVVKFTSVADEVEKASNQLAGQCAHARAEVRASDRETTLLGRGYVGSIFVKIHDGVADVAVLKRAADKALASQFVQWVMFEDARTKEHYSYGK